MDAPTMETQEPKAFPTWPELAGAVRTADPALVIALEALMLKVRKMRPDHIDTDMQLVQEFGLLCFQLGHAVAGEDR